MAKKILVVDDSEMMRNDLRNILEGADFEVTEAYNGKNGLERLKSSSQIDLILCDINMPEMDGLTMVEHVHKISELNKIPIIMLTTEANSELKKRGKENGVIAWIIKPVDRELLVVAVKKVLGV